MNFPSTQWLRLAEATLHGDTDAGLALSAFCQAYRSPVLGYVISRGLSREDAEDATQAFLLHVMERSMLRRATPERGRFRSFLLGALRHFLADRWDRARAARRGGGIPTQPIHLHEESLFVESPRAERDFDRDWAMAILERALAKMAAGRPVAVMDAIRPFLPGSTKTPSYEEAAQTSGMSESALRSEVSRARARLRESIRDAVAATVDSPAEVDAEMSWLLGVLSEQ